MLPVALRLHRNPLQLLSQYIAQKKEEPEALEKMLPFLSCFRVSKYPMKTTDTVLKTSVFGALRQTPQNSGVYAWDSVPKGVPKSRFQNLAYSVVFGTLP
jgi:hypothetical protein